MNSTEKDKDELIQHRGHFSPKQPMPDDQTSLGQIKVNISQSVPSDRVNRGPQVIVRSAALNSDIGITRKFGEGSTPLFEREGVIANNVVENEGYGEYIKTDSKSGLRGSKSSNPDELKRSHSAGTAQNKRREYVHLGCCGKLSLSSKCNRSANEKRNNPPKIKKVPYYRDEIREHDRLRRLYGDSRRYSSRSPSPPCTSTDRSRTRRRSTDEDKGRKHSAYKRTRSDSNSGLKSRKSYHDYSPYRRRRHSQSDNGHSSRRSRSRTYSPYRDRLRYRDRTRSPKSERSRNKESSRHNRNGHSPCCSHQRHYSIDHRTRRSQSPSIRQPRSTDRDRGIQTQSKESHMHMPSTYIPVPVPVADFTYSFPHWPVPQNPWGPHMAHRAPTDPYGYPLVPMIPPIRPMHPIRYARPTPLMPYGPMPMVPYRPRPTHRFPHVNPNLPNHQYRYKPQEKHK